MLLVSVAAILLATITGGTPGSDGVFRRCPRECSCTQTRGMKVVTCEDGDLRRIPTSEMDSDVSVIEISAPASRPNHLTVGRIFLDFTRLEEIRITRSNIPAIGDSSFLPGRALRHLDLSHNNISRIFDTDFKGLENLQILLLADNNISSIVSAVFQYLKNLTKLSLANNKLQTLSPRNFYLLPKLKDLDLSGNPLEEIDPDHLKDLRPLKILSLRNCKLTRLHSLLYQQLSNIAELDLSDNDIKHFQPFEFKHLRKLRVLKLDGNRLSFISDNTFDGHYLKYLGIARNEILSVATCAFCNSTVKELDLSGNHMDIFNAESLKPIALQLESLNVGSNGFTGPILMTLLKPLHLLHTLVLSNVRLQDMPDELFQHNPYLRNLSLSHNKLSHLSRRVLSFAPLRRLEVLDLSKNKFKTLNGDLLDFLRGLDKFHKIELHSNPWSCDQCHMSHLLGWLNLTGLHVCDEYDSRLSKLCARCASPMSLAGRHLLTLRNSDLRDCALPLTQPVSTQSGLSGIPLLVGIILLIVLVVLLVCVAYVKCVKGAVYYTREDERTHTSLCDSHQDKSPMFVTTVDLYDDYPKNNKNHTHKNGVS